MALDTIPKQEGGKLKAVASGTLPSGVPVIVNADGTVSVISGERADQSLGSQTLFDTGATFYIAATYDTVSNKVVVAYRDYNGSNYGTAIVGTVSGTSISFGTPVVFESATTDRIAITFDSNEAKVFISYADGANVDYITAIVGSVSGTSISFGSASVVQSVRSFGNSPTFDSNSNKVVLAYRDDTNSQGKAVVATVSGTSFSLGSVVTFNSSAINWVSSVFDSNANKVVVTYSDAGNSNKGTAIVGTVSGTSISFGSPVVFEAGSTYEGGAGFDSTANKVVMAYTDNDDSSTGKVVIGTVSGTSISFGSPVTLATGSIEAYSVSHHILSAKTVIAYKNNSTGVGYFKVGTVSGSSISFESAVTVDSNAAAYFSLVYDDANAKIVLSYRSNSTFTGSGKSQVLQVAYDTLNLTSENYIGISTGGAVADGGNATVGIIGSVSDEQSGLTSGQSYYVQTDGTVGTTPADPSVLAGTAISATKMLVKT
jgi:hypothetical protein